ncbi:MAG: RNA polymerase sigma factor [Chitinophagales bacterium]
MKLVHKQEAFTDKELLTRLQSSDEKAYRLLFDRYYEKMVITALQITKDSNIAKDAAQEVFLALWKNRERTQIKQSLSAYLKRGVINRSLNIIKSRKLHMGNTVPDAVALPIPSKGDQLLEFQDLQKKVHQAIDELPDRCREVFVLCRFEELSHKEIAAQLNISTKTVENQMTKALKYLRGTVLPFIKMLIISLWMGV